MGKPRRQKKTFKDCGHRGFGKYCHRCKQLEEAELDGNVLKVLKTYPGYNLRPGQIVKLMHGKNHNYHNSDIPDFFEQASHVRDSLHRLERAGKAACVRVEHEGRSKRWSVVLREVPG